MEQRHQFLREINLSRNESKREIQGVVEHSYRRRSLSGRKSNSDHKTGKQTEDTSNPDSGPSLAERLPSTSDTFAKSAEKTPTLSVDGTTELGDDKSKANAGYNTTPDHDFVTSSVNKDILVDKNWDIDQEKDGGNASPSGHDQSTTDRKESLRGTP